MANPFVTPPNEKSFSGLIDDAVLATGKPGSLVSIVQQANLTVRECQGLGLFARDLVEEELAVSTTPFTWNRPPFFRKMRTVKYGKCDPAGGHRYNVRWPKFLLPGKIQKDEWEYFYSASDYFVFNGVYLDDTIGLANYYWSKPLSYYAQDGINSSIFPGGPYPTRPAYYDDLLNQWMYLLADGVTYGPTTGNVDTDAAYRAVSTNWLVADWPNLVLSGIKAKVWGSAGDSRSTIEYSLYKQLQTELRLTSGYEAEGF